MNPPSESARLESVFDKLVQLVTVESMQTPLGPVLSDRDLIEDAVQKLHGVAVECNYDPVDRISLVVSDGHLKGWCRFDALSVSEKRTVIEEVIGFGEKQIVTADTSIIYIVKLFKETDEQLFFVLRKDKISGTIRYADVFSQEFRLCLFALSLELEEASLRRLLLDPVGSLSWLSPARIESAREVFDLRFSGRHMDDVLLLKCTTFIDKGSIIIKSKALKSHTAVSLKRMFARIERIRNHCAHPSGNRSEWLVLSQPKVLADTIAFVSQVINELDQGTP